MNKTIGLRAAFAGQLHEVAKGVVGVFGGAFVAGTGGFYFSLNLPSPGDRLFLGLGQPVRGPLRLWRYSPQLAPCSAGATCTFSFSSLRVHACLDQFFYGRRHFAAFQHAFEHFVHIGAAAFFA